MPEVIYPYNCAIKIWSPDGGFGLCAMEVHDQTNNIIAQRAHDYKFSIAANCRNHLYAYLTNCKWSMLCAAPIYKGDRSIIGFVYTVRVEAIKAYV